MGVVMVRTQAHLMGACLASGCHADADGGGRRPGGDLASPVDGRHRRTSQAVERPRQGRRRHRILGADRGRFFEAVDRRFAGKATVADVIEYVGHVRALADSLADRLDLLETERLILFCLGEDVPLAETDARSRFGTQVLLLSPLIGDEDLDDAELDAFLAEARAVADDWTRRQE